MRAPISPPDTGASIAADPFGPAAAAMRLASDGLEVVMSIRIGAGARPRDHALRAQINFFHVLRQSHDRDDRRRTLRRIRARIVVPDRAALQKSFSLGAGAIVDMQRMAGGEDVAGHVPAHQAKADEGDRGRGVVHVCSWLVLSVLPRKSSRR